MQINSTRKGDWVNTVESDMQYLEIKLSHEKIKSMSKNVFRTIVVNAVKEKTLKNHLEIIKKIKRGKHLIYKKLAMQNYMRSSSNLKEHEMKNIFLIRSGNVDVKGNFPHKYGDRKCVMKNWVKWSIDCEGP